MFSFWEYVFLVYIVFAGIVKITFYFKCRKVKSPCYSKNCFGRFLCSKYRTYDLYDYLDDLLKEMKEAEKRG